MSKNIYEYKPTKTSNEEVSFFLTKGRIGRKAFFLRLLFAFGILLAFALFDYFYIEPSYTNWQYIGNGVVRNELFLTTYNIFKAFLYNGYLFALLFLFVAIQAAKRIHDTNKSGWFFVVPIYGQLLLFKKGTKGNNDYGLDPNPNQDIVYFSELDNND